MLNRRKLILSAGKATVLVPAIAASCHAFVETSTADGNDGSQNVPSRPTPDELRCQALCIGRAALAKHFGEGDQ